MTIERHSWGLAHRFQHKTERQCIKCRLVKVTRHENDCCWTEFWRCLDQVEGGRTPACEVVRVSEGAAA
jgi:hypothetical protein